MGSHHPQPHGLLCDVRDSDGTGVGLVELNEVMRGGLPAQSPEREQLQHCRAIISIPHLRSWRRRLAHSCFSLGEGEDGPASPRSKRSSMSPWGGRRALETGEVHLSNHHFRSLPCSESCCFSNLLSRCSKKKEKSQCSTLPASSPKSTSLVVLHAFSQAWRSLSTT